MQALWKLFLFSLLLTMGSSAGITTNGLQCPSCYSNSSACRATFVQRCAGDQFYCFDMSATETDGNHVVAKGCTNEALCNVKQGTSIKIPSLPVLSVVEIICRPANKASLSAGSLLLALSGLLLLKILI